MTICCERSTVGDPPWTTRRAGSALIQAHTSDIRPGTLAGPSPSPQKLALIENSTVLPAIDEPSFALLKFG